MSVRGHVANCLDFMGNNRWQNITVRIHNGEAGGPWLSWTRVTHTKGGQVVRQERREPACGWAEHWRRYRKEHPELEPYWRDS